MAQHGSDAGAPSTSDQDLPRLPTCHGPTCHKQLPGPTAPLPLAQGPGGDERALASLFESHDDSAFGQLLEEPTLRLLSGRFPPLDPPPRSAV